jgi:hypothetical protein
MRAMLLVLAGLAACALLAACQPVRQPPPLTVTPAKPGDQAQVRAAGETVVIDLYSPSGIGAAQITWPGALEAEALLLRLHLNGLEGLQVSSASRHAALSVDNAPPYIVRSADGAAISSALDIDVQRGEGAFTVRLGPAWLQDGSLAVQWVDFYR